MCSNRQQQQYNVERQYCRIHSCKRTDIFHLLLLRLCCYRLCHRLFVICRLCRTPFVVLRRRVSGVCIFRKVCTILEFETVCFRARWRAHAQSHTHSHKCKKKVNERKREQGNDAHTHKYIDTTRRHKIGNNINATRMRYCEHHRISNHLNGRVKEIK